MKPLTLICLLLAYACSSQAQSNLSDTGKVTPAPQTQDTSVATPAPKAQDTTVAAVAPGAVAAPVSKADSAAIASLGKKGFHAPKPPAPKKRKKNLLLPLQPFYVLTGNVKKNSSVFLWISIRDSVVRGVARYPGSIDSLPVFGTVEPDGRLIFCGFSPDGNMEGCFSGKILDDSIFTGRWFALVSDSSWDCQLYKKDTVPQGIDTNMIASHAEGTYSYHMGDLGAAGGIIIHKANGKDLSIDIGCATGPPDYSSAMVKSEVAFDGQTAVYNSPTKPNCRLRIRVFKDFVVINFVNKMSQCNFGANVEGVFVRTRPILPGQ
jgi:hypothetical protein